MSEETQKPIENQEGLPDNPQAANSFGADQTQAKNYVWTFEGKEYPLFLVNKTGAVGMPLLSPIDKTTPIGILQADFAWESDEPFLDRLDIKTIDKANDYDDWTERENENMISKNAACYAELVIRGEATDIDEFGVEAAPVAKTRQQMLAYRKVVQSDLLGLFMRDVHIERWLPPGMTKLDALLSEPDELFFTIKIGDYYKPRHLLFAECDVPSDDAIGNYKTGTFNQSQNEIGDWKYTRDNEKRLRFGRKYIRSVQGAMLGPIGETEFDDSLLRPIDKNDEKMIQEFKKSFNTDWMIKLAESIAGVFDLGKK